MFGWKILKPLFLNGMEGVRGIMLRCFGTALCMVLCGAFGRKGIEGFFKVLSRPKKML